MGHARRPQVALALNGSGLVPWDGSVRSTFESQFRKELQQQSIDFTAVSYVGSLVSVCTREEYKEWLNSPWSAPTHVHLARSKPEGGLTSSVCRL